MACKTERDGARTWIEGVWDGVCGVDWDASQRALAAALSAALGVPVDFDELLVASTDAFAAVSSDVYQDVTYLAAAQDVLTDGARYYGFDGEWAFPESFEQARGIVRSEIDAGRAVPTGGAAQPYGCPPWGIAVGYDDHATTVCLAGYGASGGTRWHDVRGDCGREDTGPWNGRVRGLLTERNAFWLERPLFVLGPRVATPAPLAARLAVLRATVTAMRAAPHRIDYWGGVTYFMGIAALRHLADGLATLDYPAVAEMPRPDDAYDWWNVYGVLLTTADMVMRGRAAAARVFRRWADEDPSLRALDDCVPLLAEAADVGAALFDELHSEEDLPADGAWRERASAAFGRIAELDERCAGAMCALTRSRSRTSAA
ncbi:hypothetical protein HN371_10040 [Candidatus Poribacteria bacterium]|jgi:hypothetical protein|nr:hypothetical protein [Candidatus Poribacteria bacterium]MBT5535139.1 hypothetical protein [Candidatus Poribacteria bacterium]MBT7098520.1 hypothetical protein [Candidatus Poribacteria bacterium]MBT7807895.1 hypothetical protein [Candidatus Poribacteria bacterium]